MYDGKITTAACKNCHVENLIRQHYQENPFHHLLLVKPRKKVKDLELYSRMSMFTSIYLTEYPEGILMSPDFIRNYLTAL